jgi:hypothetical protein
VEPDPKAKGKKAEAPKGKDKNKLQSVGVSGNEGSSHALMNCADIVC